MIRAFAIPGLGMAARELPETIGVLRGDNPEIGEGPDLDATRPYTLQDVAEEHARRIETLASSSMLVRDEPFWVIGMSMGGMIAALLATTLRARLPRRTRFAFLVTSANTPTLPAVPDALLA